MRRCLGGQPYEKRGHLGGQPDHRQRRGLLLAPSWWLPVRPNKQWQHAPVPVRRITFVCLQLCALLRLRLCLFLPDHRFHPRPRIPRLHQQVLPSLVWVGVGGIAPVEVLTLGVAAHLVAAGDKGSACCCACTSHCAQACRSDAEARSPSRGTHVCAKRMMPKEQRAWREVIGRTGWSLSPGRSTFGPPGLCASDSSRKISDLRLSVPRSFRVPACAMEPTRM